MFQGALHSLNPVRRVGDQIEEAILLHSHDDAARRGGAANELLERVGIPAGRGRSLSRTSCRAGSASGC